MPQAPVVTIKVTYPGSIPDPSYFDLQFLNNSIFGAGNYDTWCADRDIAIDLYSQGNGFYSTTLSASVYSTYETAILSTAIPTIENPGNFDLVNWLLNQHFSASGNGYTFGEVQAAVWGLLGDDYASSTLIGTPDPAKIAALVTLANQHDGYVPDITDSDPGNDEIAVLLFPHKADGTAQQPILIQVDSAALGDYVWADSNANGVQDINEYGVQGVTVNLWRDLDDDLTVDANEVLGTTMTDATGYYKFFGLTPSLQYQLQFIKPGSYSGFTLQDATGDAADSDVNSSGIAAAVTLAPGEFNTTLDAGLVSVPPAHIGDLVWEDSNANGQQDTGEAGIAGVTVQLKDAGGNIIASTITNAGGNYGFDVLPGTYSIAVIPPAGYAITPRDQGPDPSDSDIDAGGTTGQYTLIGGQSDLSVDAGLYRLAELGDRVWLDTDGDGQQDAGEAGVGNVTVKLKDINGNLVASTVTNANGEYLFSGLVPGTYSVAFAAPAGYEFTQQDQGADSSDSDADTTGATAQTVLDSGESDHTWDAGLVPVPPAHIGDRIWEDRNANGQQDAGEAGIAGVTVQLKDAGGNVIATTTTDGNGLYGFDVLPGTYSVLVTPPAGYVVTPQNIGGDGTDSDIDGSGATGSYTLVSGETNTTADGGLYRLAELGDRVWLDADGDGQQDIGEAGAAGVAVHLKDTLGNIIATQATDANGDYLFTGLIPGAYSVQFAAPAGYLFTQQNQGADSSDSDADLAGATAQTVLDSGESDRTWDAGLVQRAHLGDRIWLDGNANGQQDAGEVGVSNLTIQLRDAGGTVIAMTVTDANGIYGFDVLPGTYSVSIIAPPAYTFLSPKDQGNDASDSDLDPNTLSTQQVTLNSGDINNTLDGGVYVKAALGDRVWLDANGNGVQDAGEAGVGSVTVNLKDAGGNVIASQQTDANGNYLFTDLVPGTYSVQFVAPAGYEFTLQNHAGDMADSDADPITGDAAQVTLPSGVTQRTEDAGLIQRASLGDRVWEDTNANGQQDAGEAGIGGATVSLLNSLGAVIATATTDANGNYLFGNLLPGNYAIQVAAPAGYFVSPKDAGGNDATDSDIDPATGKSINTLLTSGENDLTWDAGLYRKAAIGDTVWLDGNANGVQDAGENGLAGVTVKLLNAAGTVLNTMATDGNGNYLFSNLIPGDYRIQVIAPAGYFITAQDAAGNDATDSDIDPATGKTIATTLDSGETDRTWDGGLYQNAHLGDRVWEDRNANGQQDAGEAGIAGVTVQLKDAGGNVIATTTTDGNGLYGFDVKPGTYSVAITPPAGYAITPANQGNDTSDSDIDGSGNTGPYTLASGQADTTADGGLYRRAELGDRVWLDADGDGQQDAGEAGVAGVTVHLKDALGNIIGTQATDANGNYLFTGLIPGTYSVQFVAPAGYVFTQQDLGADASDSDADAGTGNAAQTVLDSGESDRTWDAGIYMPASIGDKVWVDKNANGIQDTGESGLANVTVRLLDASGNTLATTATNASGIYSFTQLKPGDYAVQVVAPTGYFVSPKDQGSNDAKDSDIDAITGKTLTTSLASGENDLTWDAGLYKNASIGDKVWHDLDADGIQDAGEVGIAGATVHLLDAAGNVIRTTTTNSTGVYLFNNLMPGNYAIQVVAPAGYLVSPRDQGTSNSIDSDIDPLTGKTVVTNLISGENDRTWDAGLYKTASIGDRVWEDTNANGVQDAGEAGIGGVTVNLLNSAGAVIGSTTTDAGGGYLFSSLMPGDYAIQVVAPVGYVITGKDQGGNDATDSDIDAATGKTANTTLASGENDPTWDAGLYRHAAIGDRVWFDLDKDGIQDAGEAGVQNVLVRLYDAGGNVVATQSTSAGGEYLFTALTPGDYRVGFDLTTLPAGYSATTQDAAGSTDANDSDAHAATGLAAYTTLESGETDRTWDMGISADVGIDIEKYVRGRYYEEAGGGEGLTPGFWKTHSSYGPAPLSGWPETGYSPDAGYEAIFGVSVPGTPTLMDALNSGGGGLDALLRHSTAALLNAANPYVDYQYSLAQVISMTQGAISSGIYDATKNLFETQNELGADLDTPAGGGTEVVTPWYDADNPTGPFIPVGGQAEFKYEVKNTGEVALANIQVSDDRIASLAFVGGDSDSDGLLDVNETWVYSATETVATGVQYVNIGTVAGTEAATGRTVTDSDAAHYITTALTSSLGDRVWLDANGNGVQDAGEAGVAGVAVNLLNAVGAVIATQATDANGNYLFNTLAPGDYAVQVVAPAGYGLTGKDLGGNDHTDSDVDAATGKTLTTHIAAGEVDLSWDAGLVQAKASIGDKVWLDCDSDGIQDANEVGLSGVTVNLLNSAGSVVGTTATDWQGNYLFNTLAPGDYAIQVLAPTGYSITARDQGTNDALDSDIDAATGKTIATTLASGENDLSWDAGLTTVGACMDINLTSNTSSGSSAGNIRTISQNGLDIHASAFSRSDSTGAWATAYLGSYSGGLGVTDTSEDGASPSHAVDNVSGRDNYVLFEFDQIVALDKAFLGWVSGDSDIQVWIGSFNNAFSNHMSLNDGVLSGMGFTEVNTTTLTTTRWADLNAGDYLGNAIVIAADTTDTSPEDYFKLQTLSVCTPACGLNASIGDKVWLDANANGVQDAGEAGLSGVTVNLLNAAGGVMATTTSDAGGNYLFSSLAPGDYAVQVAAPPGYALTGKDLGGNDNADSDFDPATGKTLTTTLTGGENDLSWDAGLYLAKARIGDKVWHDANYNGVQDAGEAGISGVTVRLKNSAGTTLQTKVTDAAGNYFFDVDAGTYKVQVVAPSGYYATKSNQGTNDAVDSDTVSGVTGTYTVTAGQQNLTVDGGLYKKASIGDRVWEDKDHDDIQDSTEPGIGNVKVSLQNSAGTTLQTAYTDAGGYYKFINLDPGTYRLMFDKTNTVYAGISMKNWMWASNDIGSNDSIDSDVNGDGVSKHNVAYTAYTTLASGENDLTWDAAITPLAIDLNGDGIQTISRATSTGTFDLLGTGHAIQSGWLSGEDGFLALDRNGNGRVDGIGELFGGNAKGDGYAKLGAFDSNGDGMVNGNDAAFADLRIWKDANGNHQTDAGELLTLDAAGVAGLSLAYQALPLMDGNGNLHLERGSAVMADGTEVDMTDVYFGISAADAEAAGIELPSLADLMSDSSSLDGLLGAAEPAAPLGFAASAANDAWAGSGLEAMKQLAELVDQAAYA